MGILIFAMSQQSFGILVGCIAGVMFVGLFGR